MTTNFTLATARRDNLEVDFVSSQPSKGSLQPIGLFPYRLLLVTEVFIPVVYA